MIIDVNKYVDFLVEHEITPEQFCFCYVLFIDRFRQEGWDDEEGLYIQDGLAKANVYKYAGFKPWNTDEIDDLIEKGFVIDENPREPKRRTWPDNFTVTDKFVEAIFATEEEFEEFWNTFPVFVKNFDHPNGRRIPLKAVVKEEIEQLYRKRVPSQAMHEKVMKALRWANERGRVNMNIKNWLGSEHYKVHWKEMRKNPNIKQATS